MSATAPPAPPRPAPDETPGSQVTEARVAPRIIVLSGPSGCGKSTQRDQLLRADPNREFLVSYTTRMPRAGEVDGKDYHFLILKYLTDGQRKRLISPEKQITAEQLSSFTPEEISAAQTKANAEFARIKTEGKTLFESVDFYGNSYGTPNAQLLRALHAGKQLIADVNLDGLRAFQAAYPKQVCGIFIAPQSKETIAQRLQIRIDEAGELSDARRAQMEAEKTERLKKYDAIMTESPHYDTTVMQGEMSVSETFQQINRAIQLPRIEGGSWHRKIGRTHVGGQANTAGHSH